MVGFTLLFYTIMKCTSHEQDDEEKETQEKERVKTLNEGFNIQDGKYQTFSQYDKK